MKLGPTDTKADLVPVPPYVWYLEEHHQQLNMPSVWGMNIYCVYESGIKYRLKISQFKDLYVR